MVAQPVEQASHRPAVGCGEIERGTPHLPAQRRVCEQGRHRRHCLVGIPGAQRGARADCAFRSLLEIEGVRPEHHGRAHRACLDQVLAAERQEASAHQRAIRGVIVGQHLAHRVAYHDLHVGADGIPVAAARHLEAVRSGECRNLLEALRVARHDHGQRAHGHRGAAQPC